MVLGSDACRKTVGSQVQFSLYYLAILLTFVFNLLQVLAFREQKLEALKLQAAIAAKQQEEEEEQLRAAEERERKLRDKKHRQV